MTSPLRRRSSGRCALTAAWLLLAAAVPRGPSAAAAPFHRGEVVPRIATLDDPEQQYSLYLPSRWDPAGEWPVLVVLDPRGRAEAALERFVAGAEAHGWVVLSSHQSRSDTVSRITGRAFQTLLGDAERRFAGHPRRLYLAGMSGTARAAWKYAEILGPRVAGVIGCAAGLPFAVDELRGPVGFDYFGLVGTTDYNYQEMLRLAERLEAIGASHRLEIFDGPHGWPPDAEGAGAAVDWLELMAMKRGLTPRREPFVAAQLAAREAAIRAAPDPPTARRHLAQLVRDFAGIADVAPARRELAALEASPAYAAARERERKLAGQEEAYFARLDAWLARTRTAGTVPPLDRSLAELGVRSLQAAAAGADREAARSAQRRLEAAYVETSFYLPEELESARALERAVSLLEVAAAIFPRRPDAYWRLARVHARAGHRNRAFAALDAAAERGGLDRENLRDDPVWETLRDDPRWLRSASPVPPPSD